jgi:Domain of unknown function (DUF4268)
MKNLSKVKHVNLREIWSKEASEFTPWLADNIGELGEALGMELELEETEAGVGEFSLDLLAKDLGTGHPVVVENQLTPTDHDHLGKLLTYAAGFDASSVIWIAESIREEHRQTLDWLNQKTDGGTNFFGVVVEVLQIDDSAPAFNFKPVVFPNEWQKTRRAQVTGITSSKAEAYRQYFQGLIDELRDKHKFTGARVAQPSNWYEFSTGTSGIKLVAVFGSRETVRVELYIDIRDYEANKCLFDRLAGRAGEIERQCGFTLEWKRLDDRRSSRVSVSRSGSILSAEEELREIRDWQVEMLLKFRKVLLPIVRSALDEIPG